MLGHPKMMLQSEGEGFNDFVSHISRVKRYLMKYLTVNTQFESSKNIFNISGVLRSHKEEMYGSKSVLVLL